MNTHSQLKTFALLCIINSSNSFASKPAAEPNSLAVKLATIDALPDHKALTVVVPIPIDEAECWLMEDEDDLRGLRFPLASVFAKSRRLTLKYWTIKKELTSCSEAAKKRLQIELDEVDNQKTAHEQEEQRCVGRCLKNQPELVYRLMMGRYGSAVSQSSILLVKNEKLEQEKTQWQQREQALQAQLRGYQALEDGRQK